MRNITWLLLILFTYDSICNENLLSKFHQHGYKIKDVRVQLMNYSKNCYYFFELKTFKHNRTTPAVNATFRYKIDVKDKLEVVVQAYKFLSNEFRHFPVRFQVNVYKAFRANTMGLQNVKRCGNVTSFYFRKDITYHVCNFVGEESEMPPLIPNGVFKIDLKVLYLNEEVARLAIFMEIYIPIPYPKK